MNLEPAWTPGRLEGRARILLPLTVACLVIPSVPAFAELLHLSRRSFQTKAIESDLPVLIEVWAPWCSSCLAMKPVLEELAREEEGQLIVGEIDLSHNPRFARQRGIFRLPAFILVADGREIAQVEGFLNRHRLRSLLRDHLKDQPATRRAGEGEVQLATTSTPGQEGIRPPEAGVARFTRERP